MSLNQDLKKIDDLAKEITSNIDKEVKLDDEIEEVAKITAKMLSNSPMTSFSIQGRDFITLASVYRNNANNKCIRLVAREKTAILTSTAKVLRADLEVDTNYTMEENLIGGLKALLGHITGRIKPEVLD